MLSLIRGLSRRHEVSLISFFDDERDKRHIDELEALCCRIQVIRRYPASRTGDPFRLMPHDIAFEFGSAEMAASLSETLAANDFDVVQAEYLQMAYLMPRIPGVVTILKEHEVQHGALLTRLRQARGPVSKLGGALLWLKLLQAEISLCRRFDRIITVSEEDRRMLTRFDHRLRVETIEAAVDTDYFAPIEAREEEHSIIFVGAFRHGPNVDAAGFLARDILPLVRRSVPDAKIYFVGSFGATEIPEAIRLTPGVVVTDWVDDLRPWLAKASVCVAPIRLGVGMRGKVLQAWAMGKPVVTTTQGCAGIEAEHGRDAWIADRAAAFADGVVRVLQDETLRQQLAFAGRKQVVARYGYEQWIGRHERLYYDAVAEQAGRTA